jgi:hypothetical protein
MLEQAEFVPEDLDALQRSMVSGSENGVPVQGDTEVFLREGLQRRDMSGWGCRASVLPSFSGYMLDQVLCLIRSTRS